MSVETKKNNDEKKKNSVEKEKEKSDKNKYVKREKTAPTITYHNVEKYPTNIMNDFEHDQGIDEHVANIIKAIQIFIQEKKLPKNFPPIPLDNVSLYYEESVTK